MAETSLTDRVLDALVTAGLLTADQVSGVREAATAGATVGAVLIERGLVTAEDVGVALEEELGVPRVDLTSYTPDEEALALVPAPVARSRRLLPLFEIDGTLTVAVGDPMDVLSLDAIATELGLEFDPVLAEPASLLGAVVQYYGEKAVEAAAPVPAPPSAEPAPPTAPAPAPVTGSVPPEPQIPLPPVAEFEMEERELAESLAAVSDSEPAPEPPAPEPEAAQAPQEVPAEEAPSETLEQMVASSAPEGPPPVDLDLLAVADSTRVAILVTDILANAAARGASRIHLLPYKDDFFLVYRVKGRLEKVASAPLSMQGALVDGFKTLAHVASSGTGIPVVGRVRARLADQDLVLTVSVVPTIAGQRLVVSLTPVRPEPRGLSALGMSEAEVRALHAMVERGRGILLLASPVAEGRSSIYYALLAHAAAAGKTVYSVERSIEYEIPAVAQVLVSPGTLVAPAAYFAAGLRQDTDVVGIDSMSTVEDIHIAVEAAGAGRLVIGTFAAADIVSAVRRMLDLGAEPHSLASALALAVGERLVRTNCPNCTVEKPSDVLSGLPGAPAGLVNKAGAGCPNCGKSGFGGVTGIFEVMPFAEPVRAAVARSVDAEALAVAARAAGMRPLEVSGLAKVSAGVISADELDRVLRLSR